MKSKIPTDAFDHYVAQGTGRSYQATADHFQVSKCAISKKAKKEDWAGRLAKIEGQARVSSDKKLAESLGEMHDRHLTLLKAVGMRVAECLQKFPLQDGMDGIRGVEMIIKMERLLAGEASKRTELSIEEITRHEIRTLLKVVPADDRDEPRLVEASSTATATEDDDDGEFEDAG